LDYTDRAYCWGKNEFAQLGTGDEKPRAIPTPVNTDIRFVSLAIGDEFTCGLTREGRVYCWGQNWEGQLGTGDTDERKVPTFVALTES